MDRLERFEAWAAEAIQVAQAAWTDFSAWAEPRLVELQRRVRLLWERGDELAQRRRARRQVAAAQRRAQKRGSL
jgi:hypothetical protein